MTVVGEFTRPLALTTPLMRGQRVKDAQWLLAGNNRFEGLAPYKDGKIDGVYGPVTGQAVRRAKYWLGYPDRAVKSSDGLRFGQTLYEYLRPNHWRPLPEEYRKRRTARLRAIVVVTPGEKALAVARAQLGYHETPWGSNRNKYGAWYGFNGVPWCAIFESWCLAQVGIRYRYSYCGSIVDDAANYRNGLYLVRTPRAGDIVIYTLRGHRFAHTGFFVRWLDVGQTRFVDLGGNTGPTSISNGGAVMEQHRDRGIVSHFVRIGG